MKDYSDCCGSCGLCDLTDNFLTVDAVYFHCIKRDIYVRADAASCSGYTANPRRSSALIGKYDSYRGYEPRKHVSVYDGEFVLR